MPMIYSSTVTRLRADRLRDDAGLLQPTRDWENATTTEITGVSVQPVTTSETRDAGGVLTTDEWRLYGPRGVKIDLVNGDRVVWDGRTLDVIGEPQSWPGLTSGWHHSEIVLKASPPTRFAASGVAGILHDEEVRAATAQQTYTP